MKIHFMPACFIFSPFYIVFPGWEYGTVIPPGPLCVKFTKMESGYPFASEPAVRVVR